MESPGPRGENLAPFLNTLRHKHGKDYENFNLTLKTILPSAAGIDIRQTKEGRVGLCLYENDFWFSSRLISEGTLRLIGLLCSIHPRNPATTVAFEEPENGVHPVRLKIISDLLKNASLQYEKQIIVTTHSPVLSGYFDANDLFVCRKEENRTVIQPLSETSLLKGKFVERGLEDRSLRGEFGG